MKEKQYINAVNMNQTAGKFPYLVMDFYEGKSVPHSPGFHTMHWHEDFQFILVCSGQVTFQTLRETITLRKGEGNFLNKNVVHRSSGSPDSHYKIFRFPEHLVSFYPGCPAARAVRDIVECGRLSCIPLRPGSKWQEEILDKLQELGELEHTDLKFYEYEVLVRLSDLWLTLANHLSIPKSAAKDETIKRMELFLEYIEKNLARDISLADLAKAANVSKSECLRCFKASVGQTPYAYLIGCRLAKAASLLAQTDTPISEIALAVGFSHPSHFGKLFKSSTGYSPRDYRKAARDGV